MTDAPEAEAFFKSQVVSQWGSGDLPPEAKAFLKSQVGGILLQCGSWGLPPKAEAF